MSLLTVFIYSTRLKKEPFTEWLITLDRVIQAIVLNRLKRVKLGNFGDCKLLKNTPGIWGFE